MSATKNMNLEQLMEELRKKYKNIIKDPPSHDEVIIAVRPFANQSGQCGMVFGKYDAFTQQIKSFNYKKAIEVNDMTYWLPTPGFPDVLINYVPEKTLSNIEYYDMVTTKLRRFPKIDEIYRCEIYLQKNTISLYGPGYNPSQKELNRMKDKLGAFFKREGLDFPKQEDIFRYFLFCYERQLLTKQIYDYDQLVYRSSHIR